MSESAGGSRARHRATGCQCRFFFRAAGGGRPASFQPATAKAITEASWRQSSGQLPGHVFFSPTSQATTTTLGSPARTAPTTPLGGDTAGIFVLRLTCTTLISTNGFFYECVPTPTEDDDDDFGLAGQGGAHDPLGDDMEAYLAELGVGDADGGAGGLADDVDLEAELADLLA